MTDAEVAKKIRADLRAKFPHTVFQVSYTAGDLSINLVGGDKGKADYPTQEQGAAAMAEAIRKTLPNFQLLNYE